MNPAYKLHDESSIFTPALIVYPELIRGNLNAVLKLARTPERLRPHVKTHKTRELTRLMLEAGIRKHKCATIAEAEMLADCGAPDVLIAYPLVGPNITRLCELIRKYPATRFSCLIDHPSSARALSSAVATAGLTVDVFLDLDVGQHRTGISIGEDAYALYKLASELPGLSPVGLHAYDGHNHQESASEREAAVRSIIAAVQAFRSRLEANSLAVKSLVCGGTPTFPIYARLEDVSGLECSPGTFILHDAGYGLRYADLSAITPAAVLLTRVISRPTPQRVTLDLGNKAVAADPVLAKRVHLLDFPEYTIVGHNEEHLIVETSQAARYQPGDVVYALPGHVCPTMALHRNVLVAEQGRIVGTWPVAARDRVLTI